MFRVVFAAAPDIVFDMFNACIEGGCFPSQWKEARMVVLPKGDDKDPADVRSYRGISLLPVAGKVLERIMVERLNLVYEPYMSSRQFGFRTGKGVDDAWHHVMEFVRASTAKYVLGVFVDFKGAFDYLRWPKVLERLRDIQCNELALWSSYFCDRVAYVVGKHDTVQRGVSRGCPQGSVCGPIIWNMMMDVLLQQLELRCEACAYADDLLLLIEGRNRRELEVKASSLMEIVREWGLSAGVQVAHEKCATMLLKGKLDGHYPTVKVGSHNIRYSKVVRYLGIHTSERLNFTPHFATVKEKLAGIIGRLRRIMVVEWGLSRRSVGVLYGGLLVACAIFGCPAWCAAVLTPTGRRKILAVQRVMLQGCVGVCHTVSTDALQVLGGAPPLDLVVLMRTIVFRLKRGLPLDGLPHLGDGLRTLGSKDRKALLSEYVHERWQERWDGSSNGRVTYQFIRDVRFVGNNPSFKFNLGLGFLLTGHGSLNAFLSARGLSDTSQCACGSPSEDWLHVLCVCPLYAGIRDLSSMGVTRVGDSFDVGGALVNSDSVMALNEFAKRAFLMRRLNRAYHQADDGHAS